MAVVPRLARWLFGRGGASAQQFLQGSQHLRVSGGVLRINHCNGRSSPVTVSPSCVHGSYSCGVHCNGSCGVCSARSSGGSISHDRRARAHGCVARMAAQLPQVTTAATVYQAGCSHSHDDFDHSGGHNASDDGCRACFSGVSRRACAGC